jgi:ABC-type antimicrobial peptide transport system permease subunit
VSSVKTGWFVFQPTDFQMYRPIAQDSFDSRGLLVRSSGDRADVMRSMRSALHAVDPTVELEFPRAVEDDYQRGFASPRFYFVLMTVLGVLGLTTAIVGLYASTAYTVSQRRREIAIRLALGADGGRIRRDIIRETLGPTAIGTIAGLLLVFWVGEFVSTLLYQVDAQDPWVLAAAALMLMIATVIGAWLPTQRASRIDPARTLQTD